MGEYAPSQRVLSRALLGQIASDLPSSPFDSDQPATYKGFHPVAYSGFGLTQPPCDLSDANAIFLSDTLQYVPVEGIEIHLFVLWLTTHLISSLTVCALVKVEDFSCGKLATMF